MTVGVTAESAVTPTVYNNNNKNSISSGRRKATSGQSLRLSLLLRQRLRKRWHKSVAYQDFSE